MTASARQRSAARAGAAGSGRCPRGRAQRGKSSPLPEQSRRGGPRRRHIQTRIRGTGQCLPSSRPPTVIIDVSEIGGSLGIAILATIAVGAAGPTAAAASIGNAFLAAAIIAGVAGAAALVILPSAESFLPRFALAPRITVH
jgi:hypothetical protein